MDAFIGEIRLFPYGFVPNGWALCDGSSIPVHSNTALYSLITNTYGGNNQAFNLPNLTDRVAIGTGAGPGLMPRTLGATGGSAEVTLTASQIPSHKHGWQADNTPGDSATPDGNLLANIPNTREFKNLSGAIDSPVPLNAEMIAAEGQSLPHPNQQPYLAMGYYICLYGEYPQRP